MHDLLVNPEFWKALSSFLWPLVVLTIFFITRPIISSILTKENLNIEIAGMKISVVEAAKNIGQDLTDLQQRMAKLENSLLEKQSRKEAKDLQADIVQTRSALRPTSIIWVDDHPSNNAFIVDRFLKDGINVEISLSTKDALHKLKNRHYDAIISDLGRKENGQEKPMAGLDLIKLVKELKLDTPILIFSGRRGLENEDVLIEAGAAGVTISGTEVIKFVRSVQER